MGRGPCARVIASRRWARYRARASVTIVWGRALLCPRTILEIVDVSTWASTAAASYVSPRSRSSSPSALELGGSCIRSPFCCVRHLISCLMRETIHASRLLAQRKIFLHAWRHGYTDHAGRRSWLATSRRPVFADASSSQDLADRMRALGWKWVRQTVGEVENNRRRLTPEEISAWPSLEVHSAADGTADPGRSCGVPDRQS